MLDYDDIIPETLPTQKIEDFTNTTFVRRNLTVTIAEEEESLSAYSSGSLSGKDILNAAYSCWIEESIKIIEEIYGFYFEEGDTLRLKIERMDDAAGRTGSTDILLDTSSPLTLAHEMTHLAQNYFMGYFPQFLEEGLAELTAWDTYSTYLAGNADELAKYLDVNHFGTGEVNYYTAGYMFYRYLAKQVSDAYDSLKSYAWTDNSKLEGTVNGELLTGNASNQTISGGYGNDTLTSYGKNSQVNGDKGNDYIALGGDAENAIVNGGSGNDTVNIGNSNSHNYVYNPYDAHLSNILVNGDEGDDYIRNYASSITINGGTDDDTVENYADSVLINGDAGNDTIDNARKWHNENNQSSYIEMHNVTINAGDGDDSVTNENSQALITGGAGKDLLVNGQYFRYAGQKVTLLGGNDDDTISNSGSNSILDGGDGNNLIYNGYYYYKYQDYYYTSSADKIYDDEQGSSNVTINGGAGNDTIYNRGHNVTIELGDGDDYISDNAGDSKIIAGSGNDTIYSYGGKNSTIDGGYGDDYIYNDSSDTTIILDADNDIVYNYGLNVNVNCGDGNDTVYNRVKVISNNEGETIYSGGKDTIYGCKGKDFIINGEYFYKGSMNVLIDGGADNDTIGNHGANSTINGGIGDDLIYNGYYYYESGNYFYSYNGKDQDNENYNGSKTSILGGMGDDTIYNRGHYVTIDAGSGDDYIYNDSSDTTITTGAGNDTVDIEYAVKNITITDFDENDVIKLYNKASNISFDTVSSVLKAGDYSIALPNFKLSSDNLSWNINDTKATYVKSPEGKFSFSSDGYSITYAKNKADETLVEITGLKKGLAVSDGKINGIDLNGTTVTLSKSVLGTETVSINKGYTLALADDVTKSSTSSAGWTINGTIATYTALSTSAGYSISDNGKTISYNKASGGNILVTVSGLKNGVTSNNGIIDGISIENNVVKVSSKIVDDDAKITGAGYTLEIVKEIIIPDGITVKNKLLTASSNFKGNEITLSDYSGVIKVKASSVKQSLNIVGNDNDNSIKGGKDADTISGGSGKDIVFGGNGNDKIYGNADNDVLKGDAGNDSLVGGLGNDTLTGGAGKDLFIYEGGNDVITDYKSGEDVIKLNPSAIKSSTAKGSDVILTTNNGTLTLKSNKDKVISFIDDNGKTTNKVFYGNSSYAPLDTGLTYDSKKTILTAGGKFSGDAIDLSNYLPSLVKVKASSVKQSLNIVGNDNNNSIKGGKGADTISGGSGKDTILGGKGNDSLFGDADNDVLKGDAGNDSLVGGLGNDTLTGGAGKDLFIYEGGNDVITDYKSDEDVIKIASGNITNTTYNNKDVIFTIGSESLTVKNAMGKNITPIYSFTFDLLDDDNFMTAELQIDEISEVQETNYSIGNFEYLTKTDTVASDIIVSSSSLDKKL